MVEVVPPLQWAQRHFGEAELGDKRRTNRTVTYAAAAAVGPSLSVPRQCGGQWKQTKGAYRLFDMPNVSFDKLQAPHRRQTVQEAGGRQVTLWVSDTTTLSFDHPGTNGLGPTSSGGRGLGMLLHSTLAVDVSGGPDASPSVLGLGHQQVWARGTENTPHPESVKWSTGIEALGQAPPGARWVHVGDAESDCWEAIDMCRHQQVGFAVRACQDRLAIAGHASFRFDRLTAGDDGSGKTTTTTLFELLRAQPALGHKKLWVRSRPGRAADWAILEVSALAVTLLPPKNWSDKPHRHGTPKPQPIQCWAVRMRQINTSPGQKPIEWVILSDERIEGLSAALKVAFWYSCRWLIEEYHKCLKTGCGIEERQLEEASRLEAQLGILAVVAVRLLQLKHQAKVNPDAPATSVVPHNYVRTLAAHLKEPVKKMTARRFWIETARLGGFLARKGDGDPGWLTLWHGWEYLETLTAGFELAEKMREKCVQ
jgi:hypothetical protein